MEFNEAVQQMDQFKESQEYKDYIGGLNPVTSDRVNDFINTDDGKKFLQPILDKYHSKSLESWKTNNLDKLINEEVGRRFPEADPKDIELSKMKAELEKLQSESLRKDLKNQALKVATEKQLPVELIDFMIGDSEETTNKNIETLEKVFQNAVSAMVDKKIADHSYVPDKGVNDKQFTIEDLNGMSIEQINQYYNSLKK